MRKALFVFWAVLMTGCATGGYTGFSGMSVPGYEAAGVVAGNAAMPYQILAASQYGWSYNQGYFGVPGIGNVPVCRLQDLQGLPQVNQPVLVRVPKGKGHRAMDALFGAGIGAGVAYMWKGADWQPLVAGGAIGASGAGYMANHEPDQLCLYLPLRQ